MKIDWKHIDIAELAAIVSGKLRENSIDSLVVGGACVSIYTHNRYQSGDIDFITYADLRQLDAALSTLGFSRKRYSRHFTRTDCPFFIEFVAPPAAVGREPIRSTTELPTKFGTIVLLTPTDCVKDRLAAFFHWNDRQALDQAVMVAREQPVHTGEIKKWAVEEGFSDKVGVFTRALKVGHGKKRPPR
jgi:hypothetical protein